MSLSVSSYSIQSKGRLITLEEPVVMGILNLTEDSFFDGGKYTETEKITQRIHQVADEGAQIIDIGATTTKPGTPISHPDEEIKKLIPAIEQIRRNYPEMLISVDTYHSSVAEACLESGANMINDISGGLLDPGIFSVTAKHRAPIVLMHIQGTPETMQVQPTYKNLIQEVVQQLAAQTEKAISAGINDIIIDPGFGFGKTIAHNFELLNKLETFHILQRPLLVGISRKSMIWKTLKTTPKDALTGTIALNMTALQKGAKILRVHDVKEAVETVKIFQALNGFPEK